MFFTFIAELAITMNSYILLRDNKESGPHTLADLQKIGLKANDLIWIECQSVGWRNPGEINELKHLAGLPPVSQTVVTEETAPVSKKVEEKAEIPSVNDNHSNIHDNHSHIFVKLPEQKNATTTYQQQEPQASYQKKEYIEPVKASVTPINAESEVETKYARSLDEIKEMYVKNMERRKRRSRFAIRIPKPVARVGMYAALVAVGAITVYLIMYPGQKMTVIADEQPHIPVKLKPRPDSVSLSGSYVNENGASTSFEDEYAFKADAATVPQDKPTLTNGNKKREPETFEETVEESDTQTSSTNNLPDHKVSIPKNEDAEFKSVPIAVIADQVSVSTNTYTVAALGGIRDLELTVLNGSGYPLDRVIVELRYLNPSGVILKTQDVQFTSIHPNGTQTIAIKKSNRGVKVAYKVIRIESKGTAYTAGLQ